MFVRNLILEIIKACINDIKLCSLRYFFPLLGILILQSLFIGTSNHAKSNAIWKAEKQHKGSDNMKNHIVMLMSMIQS